MIINVGELKALDMSLVIDSFSSIDFKPEYKAKYLTNYPNNNDYLGYYQFLAYCSTKFNDSLLIELGTRFGSSAVALAYNPTNKVISYDIKKIGHPEIKLFNIEFRIEDLWAKEASMDILLKAKLIFLDVDNHDGKKERILYEFLVNNDYQGLLVMDDIKCTKYTQLHKFWNEIDKRKYDISELGNPKAGLGLIDFVGEIEIE